MRAFRLDGEWLITKTQHIIVESFCGWVRSSGRRVFQPIATLLIGEHHIQVRGYSAIWSFIDAIQPSMPRRSVNSAMKGDNMINDDYWEPFVYDLQAFVNESETYSLCVKYSTKGKTMIATRIEPFEEPKIISDFIAQNKKILPEWGETNALYLPLRDKGGLRFVPSLVCGDFPHLTIARSTTNDDFDLSVMICSVAYFPNALDVRPFPFKLFSGQKEIASAITRCVDLTCNKGWVSKPHYGKEYKGEMFTRERDALEYYRAVEVIVSLF